VQLEALADDVNVPDAHAMQVRSFVAVPGSETTCPGRHSLHVVHASESSAVLNVPLGLLRHSRSCVALPAFDTTKPAAHAVIAAQAVDGFPSWSQLPVAHACIASVPPAQKLPAPQG